MVGEDVGLSIELAVGDTIVEVFNSDRVGLRGSMVLEGMVDTAKRGLLACPEAESGEPLLFLKGKVTKSEGCHLRKGAPEPERCANDAEEGLRKNWWLSTDPLNRRGALGAFGNDRHPAGNREPAADRGQLCITQTAR